MAQWRSGGVPRVNSSAKEEAARVLTTQPLCHFATLPLSPSATLFLLPFPVALAPHPMRIALVGALVNALLAGGKLITGIFGNSSALIADAVESLSDVLGSLIVYSGLRWASRPADDTHPYGHGKAEALAGFIVSTMLIIAGVVIAIEAVRDILTPHGPPRAFTLYVLIAVVLIKETMFVVSHQSAKRSNSSAMLADAWHHRSDSITSLAALVGISVALFAPPPYVIADEIAALFASGVIIAGAFRVMRSPLAELLDEHPGALVEQVRSAASGVPGVRDVEKVFARKLGGQYLVDMHLHVDGAMSVRAAHDLSGKVKATIRASVPAVRNVLIHVEPAEQNRTSETVNQLTS